MNEQHPVHDRDFGWAIRAMKNGETVRRQFWTTLEPSPQVLISVSLAQPEGFDVMLSALLYDGTRIPFYPNAYHLLAEDWELA